MKLTDLNPLYDVYLDDLAQWSKQDSLWQDKARRTLRAARKNAASEDDLLKLVHDVQRLRKIFLCGLEHNEAFHKTVRQANPPVWKRFTAPPADPALQQSLGDKLYNADPAKHDVPVFYIGNGARKVAPRVLARALEDNVSVFPVITDAAFDAAIMHFADEDGVKKLAADYLQATENVTTRISARANDNKAVPLKPKPENTALFASLTSPFNDRAGSGKMHFTLTILPTAQDARHDGMNYRDYTKLFFEMCDQPWDAVGKAHQALIALLNDAETIRFTNDEGTDISMNIDGFTFCNSLIARNVPGSEVFSAPHLDSVEGKIVSKGLFIPKSNGGIIENLTMVFEKGVLRHWHADKGQDIFERVINTDEGARRIGELGIGTNPHLKRHSCNGLLVEKISGSFHLALGAAYEMTDYVGDPVTVDNGNRSKIHWDITTMLIGKQGRIIVDGKTIMENGLFTDPQMDVLNRGWESIPRERRPAYWQDYDFEAHKQQQASLIKTL